MPRADSKSVCFLLWSALGARFPEITSWLTVEMQTTSGGRYEYALAREDGAKRYAIVSRLRVLISDAHEDARLRLRRLLNRSLDPLAEPDKRDPADGYPRRLHIQTLTSDWCSAFFLIALAWYLMRPPLRWIANQVTEVFPWDEAPRHLLRDRDGAFGPAYIRRIHAMGIATIQLLHVRPGRTDMSSGSSVRLGANASIIRWYSARRTCAASWPRNADASDNRRLGWMLTGLTVRGD